MSAISNKVLVDELKTGNRHGCSHLVDMYHALLIDEATHVFHIPGGDAEELADDVLLSVVENIHSFEFKRRESDFHVWVITIFRNKLRDLMRRQASTNGLIERFDESELDREGVTSKAEKEITMSIIRQYEEGLRCTTGGENTPVAARLLAIVECLERLEAWERVLLRCRALEVPYEEIAHYTGKPAAHLKVYYARVKRKFVRLLKEYYPALEVNDCTEH